MERKPLKRDIACAEMLAKEWQASGWTRTLGVWGMDKDQRNLVERVARRARNTSNWEWQPNMAVIPENTFMFPLPLMIANRAHEFRTVYDEVRGCCTIGHEAVPFKWSSLYYYWLPNILDEQTAGMMHLQLENPAIVTVKQNGMAVYRGFELPLGVAAVCGVTERDAWTLPKGLHVPKLRGTV